jgi:deoxyuridine 5'-triphosphate nucleotidohydrolase
VIVTSATNYDILIGNQWLHKAKAVIDLNAQKMQINYRGRKVRVSINVHKGVLPEMEEEDEEDTRVFMHSVHKNKSKTPKLTDEQWYNKIINGYAPQGRCPHGTRMYCSEHLNDCWSCISEVRKIRQQKCEQEAAEAKRKAEEDDQLPELQDDSDDEEEQELDITLKVKKFHPEAKIPEYKTEGAVGMDLASIQDATLEPQTTTLLGTGIGVKLPENHAGIIKTRSSLAKSEISVEGGVIDPDYTGEIFLIVRNHNPTTPFEIKKHDRIGQMLIHEIKKPKIIEAIELIKTKRGEQGFGSTGREAYATTKITELKHEKDKDQNKHTYTIGEDFPLEEQLLKILHQNEGVLATDFRDIHNQEPKYYHEVDTGDTKPIYQKARPIPPAYREWLRAELKEMEEAGIIKQAISPWASPIVLTPKKGSKPGEFAPRLCVDYRKLNAITKKDRQPLPNIQEILTTLGNEAEYYTTLDLFSGFHQIGLTQDASEKSAFITPDATYVYLQMPFGMCNAPASFQ